MVEQVTVALLEEDLLPCLQSIEKPSPAHPWSASECLLPIDDSIVTHKQASRYTSATP